MKIELTPYEAIIAEGALRDSYEKHVKHYREKGWPSIMDQPIREWLESAVDAHKALVSALRAEGYPMTRAELEVADLDALAAVEWVPPSKE